MTAAPDLGRAGEADLRHVRVLDEPLPDDRALAGDDVERRPRGCPPRARARPSRSAESGVSSAGLSTTVFPQASAGPSFQLGDVEREVPGHDQPDDAERLAEGQVDAARDRDRLAVVLVDRAGVEVEDLGDHADLAAGARDRLADVRATRAAPAPRRAPRRASRAGAAAARGRPARPRARPGTRPSRAATARVGLLDAAPAASSAIASSVAGLRTAVTARSSR